MARRADESGEERYKLERLRPQVEDLCKEFDALVDRPLDDREDLAAIFKVLDQIRAKISPPPPPPPQEGGGKKEDDDNDDKLLPRSKREELSTLLPLIRAALDQRSKRPRGQQDAVESSAGGGAGDSMPASSSAALTGCIPCVPRPSQQQSKQEKEEKEGNSKDGVSLKLLLRLTQNVLEPEQYYEWTTSYVDEERIYGWDKEAGDVIDALVAPDGSERMFRAAGIAGIHGSGKTVLAQKVFVHDRAKDNFALRLWVCVGPPDSEDRFNLLYRMLDNLGLDTAKVEDIVDKSQVVRDATKKETDRMAEQLRKEAAKIVAGRRADAAARPPGQTGKKETTPADDAPKKEEGSVVTEAGAGAGGNANQRKEEEESVFQELLKKELDNSRVIETSKIGVLLYILNMSLSKTSYMIVFDDIRAYRRDDGDVHTQGCWYSNLTLPPPAEGEWGDRLAYGLPKGEQHRGAVLVTCRKEDDAKTMVRTGLVVRPPKLKGDDAWKLFTTEYGQAKDNKRSKDAGGKEDGGKGEKEEDLLLKQLGEIKEKIVNKCLGLPVAIIEAARGFAGLEPLPDLPDDPASPLKSKEAAAEAKPEPAAAGGHTRTGSSEGIQLPEEEPAAERSATAEAADEAA